LPLPNPTTGELAILRVLWDRGPSTVKAIHSQLGESKETAYTTVLRMCQIMVEKGLLTRDERERQHVYAPALPELEAQRGLLEALLEKAFRGSTKDLVVRALAGAQPGTKELEEIQSVLDRLKKGRKR
jgi:BlaI family penicillinase repressor